MKRVPAFELEFTFRSWTLPSWLMTLSNNHLHPSDWRCRASSQTPSSGSACPRPGRVCHAHPDVPASLMKNNFCHTVFQSANPPFTKRRRVQQAEHGVIPLWTRRLPPSIIHPPPPPPLICRKREPPASVCFPSHSFCSDRLDSSIRNRWRPANLFNLINQHRVFSPEDLDVILPLWTRLLLAAPEFRFPALKVKTATLLYYN